MVIYSQTASNDLVEILYGLITWEKHKLTIEHCEQYVDNIVDIIDTIDKQSLHCDCSFETHKIFGEKCFVYKHNEHTQWYIIYDWDSETNTAKINKIISNYLTIK